MDQEKIADGLQNNVEYWEDIFLFYYHIFIWFQELGFPDFLSAKRTDSTSTINSKLLLYYTISIDEKKTIIWKSFHFILTETF